MSAAPLRIGAHMARPSYVPGERVNVLLTLVNESSTDLRVAEPLGRRAPLTLRLRAPSGRLEVVQVGAEPHWTYGILYDDDPEDYLMFAREHAVRDIDLHEHFGIAEFGHYLLQVEYTPEEAHTWRSPELAFELARSNATFLDVTPVEAGDNWERRVTWVERDGHGSRAVLFEDDGKDIALHAAAQLVALPDGAEPALSASPPQNGNNEYWVAWIAGGALHALMPPPGDDGTGKLAPAPLKLPAGAHDAHLVRPLVMEPPPPAPFKTPRCTIPVLASTAAGGRALHLYEIDRHGHLAAGQVLQMAAATVGCWATSPTRKDRLFVFALAAPGQMFVFGARAPWGGQCSMPSRWFAIDADAFLLGDVRPTTEGEARVGVVVRRGQLWERIVLAAPHAHEPASGEPLHRSSFAPPPGAEPIRARIDIDGGLHLIYRRDRELAYVPPDAAAATWKDDGLGARAAATAHLVLPMNHRHVLVACDPDHGPVWVRLPVSGAR
jgi:hypothetical protein